jgi:hypothetical protein
MANGLLEGYQWISNPSNAGNPWIGFGYYNYPPVIVLHQTVGLSLSASYVSGHSVPPHLWYNPYNDVGFQTIPLTRAAKALYQPQYGYHYTNRSNNCFQVEIVGIPSIDAPSYNEAQNKRIGERVIAPLVRWIRNNGLSIDLNNVLSHTNTSGAASEYWPGRMSEQQWADFNGVCCHVDIWGNDHWDCGANNIVNWVRYAKLALGPVDGGIETVALKGRLDQVGRGTNNGVYHRSRDRNGGWSEWQRLGSIETLQGPTCAWHTEDWLHIYAIGQDLHVYECSWSEGSGWIDFHLSGHGELLSSAFTIGT